MADDPFKLFADCTRVQLAQQGLVRTQVGESVVWRSGGQAPSPVLDRGHAGQAGAPVLQAETLVLLHGTNDQAGTWAPIVPMLSERFRLILPDLAGHGESAPHEGPIALPLIVERLEAILADEPRVTLLGNSMGGWVAMLYAIKHPQQVERLILENGSGMGWIINAPLIPRTRDEARVTMRAVNGPDDKTPDEWLDALVARKTSPMSRVVEGGVVPHAIDPHLPKLTMPVSLIWGAHDGLLPLAYARTLQQRLPDATLQIIDTAAHIPHRQQPERFVACLMETFSPSARA